MIQRLPPARAGYRHRWRLAGVVLAALGLGVAGERSAAYVLLDNGAPDYIVPASEALRWSSDVWGPGQTLVWEIEDGPGWELLLGP